MPTRINTPGGPTTRAPAGARRPVYPVMMNGALQQQLKAPALAGLLAQPMARATLDISRVAADTFVTSLKARSAALRSPLAVAADTRLRALRQTKGKAIQAAIASRALRTPQQVIDAFVRRAALPADPASLASGAATLIVRSSALDEASFRRTLSQALGVDLVLARIGVSRMPLAPGALTSYAVVFPVAHQKVGTELMNLAWALRQSKAFHSVGVSGLQGRLFELTPTAATHAERNFGWHLDITRTTRAHQLPPGAAGKALGEGVTIAHIDTGWAAHSQYNAAQIDQANSFNVVTGKSGGTHAQHSITNGLADAPNISHGTATGSVILGGDPADGRELTSTESDGALRFSTFPNGVRQHIGGRAVRDARGHLRGAAPRAQVLPIKLISDTALAEAATHGVTGVGVMRLFDNDLIRAVRHAIDAKAHVISLSIGGLMHDEVRQILDEAIVEHGIIVAAAAGQTYLANAVSVVAGGLAAVGLGADDSVVLPAAYANVIAVAGCSPSGAPWSESHRGPNVDITAPADAVWFADYKPKDDRSGQATRAETLECASGTSFAAPQVASAAALWLAHHGRPTLMKRYHDEGVPLAWVFRQLLQQTARALPDWDDGRYGSGILDAEALLRAPLPAAADVAPPPRMLTALVPAVSAGAVAAHDAFLELMNWAGEQQRGAERQAALLWAAGQQAADEAMDSLVGAWTQLDAAAKGAAAGLQREAALAQRNIEQAITDLNQQAEDALEDAGQQLETLAGTAADTAEEFADNVGEAASDAWNAVAGFFG